MVGKKDNLELDRLLQIVVDKVSENFVVDEIILFGSYAKGTANDLSDVDVAVVSPELNEKGPMFENSLTIKRKAQLYEPYLQLVAFSSQSFYSEKCFNSDFIKEIKSTGKVIFSRSKVK